MGCAKNLYDAEVMTGALLADGWIEAEDPESAEVILVNSCGFIEPAQTESIEAAFEQVSRYPDARVIMTGCLAQRYPEVLATEMPELAGLFGNRRPEGIAEFLRDLERHHVSRRENRPETPGAPALFSSQERGSGVPRMVPTGEPDWHRRRATRPRLYTPPGTAHLKIAEGCVHNCAFCAIPQIRGTLRSRPVEAILEEFQELIDRGIREVNLIAQDLSLLGLEEGRRDFLPLLSGMSEIQGAFWVRLLYIYPEHFPFELLDLCRQDSRLLPYFDLPVQHASSSVLRGMGRPATPDKTLQTVKSIQGSLPEATIRTTFLVGYPGEGASEFEELLAFQREARFDWMGAFVYSPQEGTRGFDLAEGPAAVPEEAARDRAERLYEAQEAITRERLSRWVGTTTQVLVEEGVTGEDLYFARGAMQAPEVDGTILLSAPEGTLSPGEFYSARITGVDSYDLRARLLSDSSSGR